MIKSIAIEFVPAKQVGMDVNTIIGDGMASRNSQSIELSSSLATVTPHMRVPKCRRDCKQKHRCDSQKISVFRCE